MAGVKVGTSAGSKHVEIEGLDELIADFEDLPRKARPEFRKGMRNAGAIVAADARARLQARLRTGRVYLYDRKGLKRLVRASAPGEAPAKVTGGKAKSVRVKVSRSGLSVRVLSADPTAHLMEYGTIERRQAPRPARGNKRARVSLADRHATDTFHVEARPFLRPALAAKKQEVLQAIELGLLNALKATFRSKGRR